MVELISNSVRALFDAALYPLSFLPPWLALLVASLLTAMGLLVTLRAVSDQSRLRSAKRGMAAGLLEMRLFNDDLGAIFRAQGRILAHLVSYWRATLVPVLVLALPLTLALTHLDSYYGTTGFAVGRPMLVTASWRRPGPPAPGAVGMDGPEELQRQGTPLWFPGSRELVWQVTPLVPMETVVGILVDSQAFGKTLSVTDHIARRSSRRSSSLSAQLLHPSEAPLPAGGPIQSIAVTYPPRRIDLLGWRVHWLAIYLVGTLVMTVGLRRRFGVELWSSMGTRRRSSARSRRPGGATLPPKAVAAPRAAWPWLVLIALAGGAVNANTLDAPFLFDDLAAIVRNTELHQWPDVARVWRSAPDESPLAGRPLVTLSLALTYAWAALDVTAYRIGNVVLHILCASLVFGLVRRTIALHSTAALAGHATAIAIAAAGIWLVHPLNSEVVNYVTQRTESMMALLALTTLYASARSQTSTRALMWQVLSVVSCALGMSCKESMATVPVLVVLYDRAFVHGSFAAAFRARWRLYLALGATWLALASVMASSPRTSSTGFASGYVSPFHYLLQQAALITRYLWLIVWPRDLVVYYGWAGPTTIARVLPQLVFITALLAVAGWAAIRRPRVGYLGAWFFITLAPASSVVPIASEVGAERRMYLPLAAITTLAAVGLARAQARSLIPLACAAGALGVMTMVRNRDYRDGVTLAQTVVARWPTGAAEHMLGTELVRAGRQAEGLTHLERAVVDFPFAQYDLGVQLLAAGRFDEAISRLRSFVWLEPRLTYSRHAEVLIADALMQLQRWPEAVPAHEAVLRVDPANAGARANLAIALVATGRVDEAVDAFRRVAEQQPDDARAAQNLGRALLDRGRPADLDEAAIAVRRAIALSPGDAGAQELAARLRRVTGGRDPRVP